MIKPIIGDSVSHVREKKLIQDVIVLNNINTYTKDHVTKDWLLKNNFIYSSKFSDLDDDVYTHRFHVYKYGDAYILDCELSLFKNTGKVIVNVYDCNTRNIYAPFYHVEYGRYDGILSIINERIGAELEKLKIRKVNYKNGYKNKEIERECKNSNKRKYRSGRK